MQILAACMLESSRTNTEVLKKLAARESNQPQARSYMKAESKLNFVHGTDRDFARIHDWIDDFERVAAHLGSGYGGLCAEDNIVHLLSCWPKESDVGDNMRMDQKDDAYLLLQRAGNFENCYGMLIARLIEHAGWVMPTRSFVKTLRNFGKRSIGLEI